MVCLYVTSLVSKVTTLGLAFFLMPTNIFKYVIR